MNLIEDVARRIGAGYDGYVDPTDTPNRWPIAEAAAKLAIAAVLDDLIQRAPLGRTESPTQFLSRAKKELGLTDSAAPSQPE